MTESAAEHLTPESVEEYFRSGIAAALPMSTEGNAVLEIDPQRDELRLLVPAAGADPEVTAFERISLRRGLIPGREGVWFTIQVDAAGIHYEAYSLIESIVDQMRSGASIRHAVSEAVAQFRGLLASRTRLTDEKEAGLIGELLVLRHLVDAGGEDAALQAWLGPSAEEHDFGLSDYDAEVKTTRSEDRAHLIGSETQLEPQPGRPLFLISIQITLAGGAQQGFTLPELIDQVRAILERTRRTFDSSLKGVGWEDDDRDLYRSRFQIRSIPRAYRVDDAFPAITRPRLDSVVPQNVLVSSVSYRVDVTSLPFSGLSDALTDFCEVPA